MNKLSEYSKEDIEKDISLQITIEKEKSKSREVTESDYVKDPVDINVKDQEGEFNVSKFRQM